MFVGHGLVAFALVAALARWAGWAPERALRIGALAGLFATVPDVDILYGPVGLLGGVSGLAEATAAFWETGNVIHRGPTHSLVLGAVAAVGFGLGASRRPGSRLLGAGVAAGLVAVVAVESGGLGGIVMAAFAVVGTLLARAGARLKFSPASVGAAAAVGLLSHPLGDLFTGTPPSLLYPFDVTLVPGRVELWPDETLHLLSAFGLELATVWLALLVVLWLTDRPLRVHVNRRATFGMAYALAALTLPAPTLERSYHFVFSVLAIGVVGFHPRHVRRVDLARVAATGLAAVTIAWLSYVAVYRFA